MNSSRILVTGGAGFIGSNFIQYLLDKYPDISIINFDKLTYAGNMKNINRFKKYPNYKFIVGDICNQFFVSNIFKEILPDIVVNFAAESHVDKSINDPGLFLSTNVNGVNNLLRNSLQYGIDKYIQISTDEVYGSIETPNKFTEKTCLNPRNPYSASKAGADMITQAYHHTFGLPINITRCSNNYGKYQHIEKFIPMCISKCLKKESIPIYKDGMNIRDWIHVSDHCSAIDLVIQKGIPGEIYNIGADNERTNMQIADFIIHYIGYGSVKFVKDRKGHDKRYAIDASKIRQLGWEPLVSFDNGLKETIDWYKGEFKC